MKSKYSQEEIDLLFPSFTQNQEDVKFITNKHFEAIQKRARYSDLRKVYSTQKSFQQSLQQMILCKQSHYF
jgi:hypothetical protein